MPQSQKQSKKLNQKTLQTLLSGKFTNLKNW